MGNFETIKKTDIYYNISTSASGRNNIPEVLKLLCDLNTVKHALLTAGLLQKGVPTSKTRAVINRAIENVQNNLCAEAQISNAQHEPPDPGTVVNHAIQNVINQERLTRSHQLVAQSQVSSHPQKLISSGMKRALSKLQEPVGSKNELGASQRRALLPTISMQTFQTNRRLVEILYNDGDIPNLETIVASSISNNGKQGYSDVKDFIHELQSRAPDIAKRFVDKVQCELDGIALRRFHKLIHNQPPAESDFKDSPQT